MQLSTKELESYGILLVHLGLTEETFYGKGPGKHHCAFTRQTTELAFPSKWAHCKHLRRLQNKQQAHRYGILCVCVLCKLATPLRTPSVQGGKNRAINICSQDCWKIEMSRLGTKCPGSKEMGCYNSCFGPRARGGGGEILNPLC